MRPGPVAPDEAALLGLLPLLRLFFGDLLADPVHIDLPRLCDQALQGVLGCEKMTTLSRMSASIGIDWMSNACAGGAGG